jgi:hypothetical protein
VLSAERFNISLTPIKSGLSFSMMQELGESETSQSVKANSASMVLSEEIPGARCTCISTFSAVLSSIFLILILPLSLALMMDSMRVGVVFPKGISVMTRVMLSSF